VVVFCGRLVFLRAGGEILLRSGKVRAGRRVAGVRHVEGAREELVDWSATELGPADWRPAGLKACGIGGLQNWRPAELEERG